MRGPPGSGFWKQRRLLPYSFISWPFPPIWRRLQNSGCSEELTFGFWNWVGGRYSMWSAIGLSLCCSLGYDVFEQMLRGAEHSDEHFRCSNPREHSGADGPDRYLVQQLFGLVFSCHPPLRSAVAPVSRYLQQADMESNGKYVDRTGKKIGHQSDRSFGANRTTTTCFLPIAASGHQAYPAISLVGLGSSSVR